MLVSRSDRSRSSVERASVTKRDIERDTRNEILRLQDIQRTVLGAHTQLTACPPHVLNTWTNTASQQARDARRPGRGGCGGRVGATGAVGIGVVDWHRGALLARSLGRSLPGAVPFVRRGEEVAFPKRSTKHILYVTFV